MPSKGRLSYNLEGIASLLKQHEFRVPTYQRSYAWDASNASEQTLAVDDFWNDLSEALNGQEPDYFLGSIVLTPSDDDKRLTIIDGQQRLATTSLLLAALRDIWEERGEPKQVEDVSKYLATYDRRAKEDVPKLILNEEDDPFYRGLIIDGTDPDPTRESHERLSDAYDLLKEKLDGDVSAFGRHAEARLLSWLDFLDDQVVVITVEVPTEADAFVIFETLNDRGAALTIGDLLKNYLFMRSGSRLDTVKTSWIAALTALDVSAENETFVMFLRHHWSSKYGATRERDLYASIKANIKSSPQAVAYAAELAEAAKDYAALMSPSDAYWQRVGFTTTTSTNVDILLRLELEQNRPLLLAVMKKFSKAEIRKTLNALVNWSVRGIIVGGIGGGRTEKAYADAAVKVRAGKITTAAGLLNELAPIVSADAEFEEAFRNVRITRTRISRYLLLALERTARGDKEPELVPNRNEDEVNLEHILPRNAKQSDWPAFTPEEVASWSNRLGNHCLLKKTHNNKIGNKPWSAKKPILSASSLRLTKMAGRKTNWTQKEIVERQRQLASYAVKTWPRKPR